MDIQAVYQLVESDRHAVDRLIRERLYSDVALVNQIGHYIVNSGGKRLRPILLLLSAGAFGYQGTQKHDLAAVIEFIHTATLLHDDVVDGSILRRGRDTANAVWGNPPSVLVGDFLYSRAFQMMVAVGSIRVMQILSNATNTIAEGEVKQLLNVHNIEVTEEAYLDVIHCKTAKLFEAASQIGAVLANQPPAVETAMATYGRHLGTAYQLVDDLLDYSASSEQLGKNVGDDLAEGKPTLPLIYLLQNGSAGQKALVRDAIEHSGKKNIDAITAAIESTGALAYTSRSAQREADLAIGSLEIIPESPYKQALISLAQFSVARTF